MADDETRLRAKQLAALASLPLEEAGAAYEHLENAGEDGRGGFLGYSESTYIDRRVAAGRRNPFPCHAIWGVES